MGIKFEKFKCVYLRTVAITTTSVYIWVGLTCHRQDQMTSSLDEKMNYASFVLEFLTGSFVDLVNLEMEGGLKWD